MTKVTPRENESVEDMLKRFLKKTSTDQILQELKEKRYYEKSSDKKRKAKAAGKKRAAKEKRKTDQYIKFHNENKIRPRKPREEKKYEAPKKVETKRPKVEPKIEVKKVKPKKKITPITSDSLKALQDKFK